jgi:hypothetical protein
MSEPECRSEVARLMQQISEANEAAYQALYGLAQGTAQHAFITTRMERMGEYHEQLVELVGEHEAALLVCRALDGDGELHTHERIAVSL